MRDGVQRYCGIDENVGIVGGCGKEEVDCTVVCSSSNQPSAQLSYSQNLTCVINNIYSFFFLEVEFLISQVFYVATTKY